MNVREFLHHPDSDIYLRLPYVVLDVETTNLDKGDSLNENNSLLYTGFYVGNGQKYIGLWYNQWTFPAEIINRLQGDILLVGHNIKFDLRWLARAGLDLSKVFVWDTMLGEKVLLGNNPENLRLDLNSVAERHGLSCKTRLVDNMIKHDTCPSTIPKSLLEKYCRQDVMLTNSIFLKQRHDMYTSNRQAVMLTRCLLTPVLADIETNGLCLDAGRVEEEYNKTAAEYNENYSALREIADINWNSPQQKAKLLYEDLGFEEIKAGRVPIRTTTGKPKTDLDVIKRLNAKTKEQRVLKECLVRQSELNAKLTKSLEKFKECVNDDGFLYANFHQHITRTHRLSSSGTKQSVQLQNLPRIFKPLFKARQDDWYVVEADGSNLEFRVAVELGDDEQGRADIADPSFDAHNRASGVLTGAGQPTNRQDAKAHTFKPLYGGSSGTAPEREYYEDFKARYPGITATQERWKYTALREKQVRMPWGMIFYFPKTRISRSGYQEGQTQICNYPVQSFATADIIPIAVTGLWHDLKYHNMSAFIVNTIHDSAILEAPEEERDKLNEIIAGNFKDMCYNYLKDVYKMDFKTPLGVNIKWGKRWSEGEEISL